MSLAFQHLRQVMASYTEISDATWQQFKVCCSLKTLNKGEILYQLGSTPTCFAFLHQGLMRAYLNDEQGKEYNKYFFSEGRFPGCMSALLKNEPSFLAIEAIDESQVVEINFRQFRTLLNQNIELMRFQINYLETHWLLEKEPKEIGYLQFEAKDRYLTFLDDCVRSLL